MRRLSPLRRAYTTGFRRGYFRGLHRARAEFFSQTEAWQDKLRELEDSYGELIAKIRRERAIRDAVDERAITAAWLH